MPIYEYECAAGHRTERVKSIKVTDRKRDNDICDQCGKKATLASSRTATPILVGRGFHANDYGSPTK
jgi:putative FmdB family regulatory protein